MTHKIVPRIFQAAHRISVFIEEAKIGITPAEAFVLSALADQGDATIARLHRAFGHKRSTLTSILDRLEARGYVSRQLTKLDRRTYIIHLSAAGLKAAAAIRKLLTGFEKRVLGAVTGQQVKGFEAVVDAVAATR
jgi:DNA-binding MarR family transcriptional regulator